MGKKGAKLKDFSSFSKAIHNNISKFVSLKTYQLKDLNTNDRSRIFSQIESLFENLDIMETDSCLVGNSKLMHHILPDLVPPIDREHTLMFFFNSKSLLSYDKEKQKFSEILENYWTICKKIDLQYEDYQKYPQFTSSIPKLIDNAIIGYIMKNNADA
ncbi:hypothetical protein [Methanoregula sp.]|uniref:hypothetical protein n=1 Tax=Methanoregula sp. TaxID=2052170 RepID=UPI003567C701